MTTPLEAVHAKAYEERAKAPVMNDPQVATPGTFDEAKEDARKGLEAELDARFSPETVRADSAEGSAHNPTAVVETVDESGNVQEPVGGPSTEGVDISEEGERPHVVNADYDEDDDESVAPDPDAVDSQYDPVRTTNDIRIPVPEGEEGNVDVTSPTPDADVAEMTELYEAPEGASDEREPDLAPGDADTHDEGEAFAEQQAEAGDDDGLDAKTKAELRAEADARGVEVDPKANKEQLLAALRA